MKTLCGLLAATLLLSFAVCSDVIARESFESSDKATKIEIGRYQLVAVGDEVFLLDTATGKTEFLSVLDGMLTFMSVISRPDFGVPKGVSLSVDDPRVKPYLELLKQVHGQYIRRRTLHDVMKISK